MDPDIDMLGSHLSVAGGYVNALLEAERLNMQTVQIFTKNQRQWRASPMTDEAADDWLRELHRLRWTQTVSHASYLINLSEPDDAMWQRAINAMIDEVERAQRLEVPYVVLHPGSHKDQGEQWGIKRIAKALDKVVKSTAGSHVRICLETTVGGGTQIGARFDHLAALRDAVKTPERIATCLDTCHISAAGYDMSTRAKAKAVFDEFDAIVGLKHLVCMHLNDSMTPLGSHRDRHEHIGKGTVGVGGFAYIMNDPTLRAIPKILETKKGETDKGTPLDTINIRRLRKMVDVKGSSNSAGKPRSRRKPAAAGR